jgi:DnaJ-class molecular chaperone
MSSFRERKADRKAFYEKYVKGWKLVHCIACNGSGYYDNTNRWGRTPKCGSCEGTGKVRQKPNENLT